MLGDAGLDRQAGAQPGRDPEPRRSRSRPRASPTSTSCVANKSLALFPSWDGQRGFRIRPDVSTRTLDAAPELAGYDFIFFDAPPSFGPLTLSVLRAAQEIVLPVPLTFLALDGCAELLRTRGDGAHPLRQSGAAHLDGRTHLLPPHAISRTRSSRG